MSSEGLQLIIVKICTLTMSSHFIVTLVLLSLDFILSTINSVHHHEESFVNIQKNK